MKTFTIKLTPAGICKAYPAESDGSKKFEFIDSESIEVRDEYHSMHELYQHRMALTIALFNMVHIYRKYPGGPQVMKSKLHHDGTMFEGDYFIVMIVDPQVGQISYRYKLKHWDKFRIPEVERTPEWDGHTSLDALERLMKI